MTFVVAPRAIVIDASVAVDIVGEVDGWHLRMAAWVATDALLIAPPTFPFETANALLVGKRESLPAVRARLRALAALDVETSEIPAEEILDCVQLAHQHGLTVYDAAYLQLATFLDAELATRDKALARAARAEGLVVHD